MKLQISFDFLELEKAILVAKEVEPFADILEIGSTLIYMHGIKALQKFKETFPEKEIFADIKLIDRVESIIKSYSEQGASYISLLAGTTNNIIQYATKTAHNNNCKIALDLIDSSSIGQSALDAEALDVDQLIFHGPSESNNLNNLLEEWESVQGNTKTPIFIGGGLDKKNIDKILKLKPNGIIIGCAITKADAPAKEAEYFKNLLKD